MKTSMRVECHLVLATVLLCAGVTWVAQPAAAQTGAPASGQAPPAQSGASTGADAAAPSPSPAATRTAAPQTAAAPAAAAQRPRSGAGTPAQAPAQAPAAPPVDASAPAPAVPPAAADRVTAICRGELVPPTSKNQGRVQGVITAQTEELLGVRLVLEDKTSSNHYLVDHFEPCPMPGHFAYSIEVPPGTYDLTLSGRDFDTETATGLGVEANQTKRKGFLLVKEQTKLHPSVLWLPLLYLVSIWLIRWNNIAKPSRLGVIAEIRDLLARVPDASPYYKGLLFAQQELLKRWTVLDWLFWSRGQEMATWHLIHKTELAMLESAPTEKVDVRLLTVGQRLAEMDKSAAKSLSERITAELKDADGKVDEKVRRQLLVEATSYVYYADENDFAELTSWQNKSFWLTLVGVILIAAVGVAEGHAALFIAGGVGGFLSRLTRELKRADVPTDYGASWSSLFLSPVAGAISGWFGVALVMLLTDPTVGVLGGPLKVINWDSSNLAATLAAAFVLGFSERLFDRIVSQLEESIDKKKEGAEKTAPQTAPPAGPPGAMRAKPVVVDISPNPVPPGGQVSVQLGALDPATVTGVVLATAAGEREPLKPKVEGDQLKFTIAADTAPATYRIVFLTTDQAQPRTQADQELTVARG
jgi:hypothetical protein